LSSISVFFNSIVSSPIMCFKRAFSSWSLKLLLVGVRVKGAGGLLEELVPPLVVLGLGYGMFGTQFGHRFAFKALEDDHGFLFRVPFSSFHG
jgi:hypothetical protein